MNQNTLICEGCKKPIGSCKCPIRPPFCFYPRDFPHHSAGFDKIQYKRQKKREWNWQPPIKIQSRRARILNQGGEHANDLIYINPKSRRYFLHLLRASVDEHLENCSSDPLIKSLARNVFAKKIRLLLKMKAS